MRLASVLTCSSAVLCFVALASGTVWYVDAENGDDNANEGTGWNDAFASIQHALDVSVGPSGDTGFADEIRVAKGTYYECIEVKSGQRLYGGWDTTSGERDPAANVTVIDASGVSSSWDFVISIWREPGAVIDGFTIRNGAYGDNKHYGAISVQQRASIIGNEIMDNSSSSTYPKGSAVRVSTSPLAIGLAPVLWTVG